MNARDLRRLYLEFFQGKGHMLHPSGSLVPYDVTGRLDESLLFNGAGMVQFKPYFRGVAEPPSRRLVTSQKCLRTGDIDEVGDLSHLTFFEMLGNFSFGDYFKAEAVDWSWEFLTGSKWLNLEPSFLSFTVFEQDGETRELWADKLRSAGIDPDRRLFYLGEDKNYWPANSFSSGPPGPCGPNSEMFYWTGDEPPSGPYSREDYLRDDAAGHWLEIWNDVFIQYDWQGRLHDPARPDKGYAKLGMPELPFRSIDTGMGLERTAAALGGKASVYDTDLFGPLLDLLQSRASFRYGSDSTQDRAARVVCDHLRAACFCIADGVLPGNTGRGYVLRRLIRRAVLTGQQRLGFQQEFMHDLVPTLVETMGDAYAELVERVDTIRTTLHNEELSFRRNLASNLAVLSRELDQAAGSLAGEVAFRLYDTYGFPVEVTQELASERGLGVDMEGYQLALAEAQERSRAAGGMDTVYGGVGQVGDLEGKAEPTRFVGYADTRARAVVVARRQVPDGWWVALDQTPFYVESGGQVSDTGLLRSAEETWMVQGVAREAGVVLHRLAGSAPEVGTTVRAEVDPGRRDAIRRHHTATHLLHAALRQVLGTHVAQAGSLVSPDELRFDFTHGQAMSPEQIAEVERLVNEHSLAGLPVKTYVDVPLADARAMGAMALFGEKYADRVRVVQVGDMDPEEPSFSRELCGGTHVSNTGQVGLTKIVHEGSAASGVRRISAVAGLQAYGWVLLREQLVREAAALLKAQPESLVAMLERTLDALKEERRKRELAERRLLSGASGAGADVVHVGAVRLLARKHEGIDPKLAAQQADEAVSKDPGLVVLSAVIADGKVIFSVKAGPLAVAAGAHAGNLVREVAKVAGGGGGGRPDFATAGGKELDKVDAALDHAEPVLREQVRA